VAAVNPPSEDPKSTTPSAPPVSASRRCSIRVTLRSKELRLVQVGDLEIDAPFPQALLHELALAGGGTARNRGGTDGACRSFIPPERRLC